VLVRPVRGRGTAQNQVVQRDPRRDVIGPSTRPITTDVSWSVHPCGLFLQPRSSVVWSVHLRTTQPNATDAHQWRGLTIHAACCYWGCGQGYAPITAVTYTVNVVVSKKLCRMNLETSYLVHWLTIERPTLPKKNLPWKGRGRGQITRFRILHPT